MNQTHNTKTMGQTDKTQNRAKGY